MVKFMPPPANMQDRVAYDYLYQLQEYLRVSLANLGSGIGGESAELTEDGNLVSTAGSSISAATQSQYEALKALIIKTAVLDPAGIVSVAWYPGMIAKLGAIMLLILGLLQIPVLFSLWKMKTIDRLED